MFATGDGKPRRNAAAADLRPLTGLRFFAAALILCHHLREEFPRGPLDQIPGNLIQGVSFFFVLSGFILAHVYSERKPLGARDFMWLRFARLYPTHLAALLLPVFLLPWSRLGIDGSGVGMLAGSFLAKLFLVDALLPMAPVQWSWNGASWSISTEMFFYLAFPFLLSRLGSNWLKVLGLSALLVIAVYTTGVLGGYGVVGPPVAMESVFQLGLTHPAGRGFEFVLGMCAYRAWRKWLEPRNFAAAWWTLVELSVLAVLAVWFLWGCRWIGLQLPLVVQLWLVPSGSCWIFALLIPIIAGGQGLIGRMLSTKLLIWLGEISFAVYMYHQTIIRAAHSYFGADFPLLPIVGVTILAAALSHRFLEVPARRMLLSRTLFRQAEAKVAGR